MELLNSDQALKFALGAAEEMRDSRLKLAFTEAAPQPPLLVQRIDKEDSFYFIVPFYVSARETARVIINAFDGTLEEASGITERDASLPRYLAAAEAMSRLFSEATITPKWERTLRQGMIGQHPVLVWRPCVQSSSPFMPFYQFSTGRSFVYLRVDGQLSESLRSGPV